MSPFALQPLLLDRLFSDSFGFGGLSSSVELDWKETKEAHIFKFDLPGLTKDDVTLQVHDDRVLHISAYRNDSEDEDDGQGKGGYNKWHCRERTRLGRFRREFRLPENAVVDQIKASMRDGELIVTVPKDQKKKKNNKHNKHKQVDIDGVEDSSSPGKGLGRFVCCKA